MAQPTQGKPFAALTPERLLRDIAYYEGKAQAIDAAAGPEEQGMRAVYRAIASDRHRLLAALEDGHPEAWTDYPA